MGPCSSRISGLAFWVFLAMTHDIWNLSSSTRDQTHTPYIESVES